MSQSLFWKLPGFGRNFMVKSVFFFWNLKIKICCKFILSFNKLLYNTLLRYYYLYNFFCDPRRLVVFDGKKLLKILSENLQNMYVFSSKLNPFEHANHCVKAVHVRSYSVRMWENVDQNHSEYGQFLRSKWIVE